MSSGGVEIALGLAWIASTLAGDSTMQSLAPGGFYRGMAPIGTATPFVVYNFQSGTETLTANAFRLFDRLLFQIKAVGPATSSLALVSAAKQIDALFGGPTSGTTPGGLILACYRDGVVQYDQLVNNEQWAFFGGLYRMEIQAV